MIGCILLTGAGLFLAARLVHWRRHHAWGGCGGPWQGGPRRHWRRHHGHHGWHHGWNDNGWDGWQDPMDPMDPLERGPWRGGGFFVRGLARHLDATPEQAETIRKAADELRQAATKLRGEAKATRKDVAAAFRRSSFDEVAMGELYARHDGALEELRKAFVGAGSRIHDALDEKQRERLAALIERGWRPGN
jgi:hypothetical protein